MSEKYSAPAIDKTGFNCPHCGVRAIQHWANLYKRDLDKNATPQRSTVEHLQYLKDMKKKGDAHLDGVIEYVERLIGGDVFVEADSESKYVTQVYNLDLAICDHCGDASIWLVDRMVYPQAGIVEAHDDMPDDVKGTFVEASSILDLSPRASAALSRLAIQQLCVFLKCRSSNLNDQIGELVERGLNPEIAKMLDAVRVIGNNAVHPGEIALKDDRGTAEFLLRCINRICQRLITEKLEAEKLFDMLPRGAKAAIERRDKPKELPKL